jgi:uncharacterized protein
MNVRKTLGVWAALAVALYVVFLCLLYISQRTLIYPGTMNRVAASPPHAEGADVFRIATAEGTVDAIFLPAVDGAVAGRKPVMIYAHGNGEVIDYWLTGLQSFREHGIGVLLVEYPGYGRSTGLPSEKSIRASMEAAFDRIAADPRVDRDRIFGFGQSLGGGAICALARSRPLRALILQSAFPSLDIFAAGYWAPTFLLRDHFDNLAVVRNFSGPLLVIHGREDRLVPWEQAQRLASASKHSTFKLYDCGHGCWDPQRLPFWRDALPFLREAGVL